METFLKNDDRFRMVIPTHNRPEGLRRVLDYYNAYRRNLRIIVADSSFAEIKEQNRKTISMFSNLEISYFSDYSPEDDIMLRFLRKISDAINHVTEEYCLLCPDDGFVTPRGISQSIDFLDENSDFTVAHGHYIAFYKGGKSQFLWKPVYPYKSITFSDARDRLLFHFSEYYPTTLGVHRTDLLKLLYEETKKFTEDLRFCELLPSALALVYGKMKHLDVLYGAFEYLPTSLGETTGTLWDFVKANTYFLKYRKFRYCLAMHLSKSSELNEEDSKKVVDVGMSAYLSFYWPSIQPPHTWKNITKRKIKDIFAHLRLSDLLYRNMTRARIYNAWTSEDSPLEYYIDFNEIRRFALDGGTLEADI
jgi:glycosyltransferase domain-containing protein